MRTPAWRPLLALLVAAPLILSAQGPGPSVAPADEGDAYWASGLFEEAEAAYDRAVSLDPQEARGHHGRARLLAARGRLDAAMAEALEAARLAPSDPEIHHTLGVLYQRQRRYHEAARALDTYLRLLPKRDRSARGQWTRGEIRFLNSFDGRSPLEIDESAGSSWTVPVRIDHDKVTISVRLNGGRPTPFVLDTGAEQTVISRDVARASGVVPVSVMQTAGVGDVGLRSLQIGRIDRLEIGALKVKNVPCVIKSPPLRALPTREPESISPLALGLSMRLDYAKKELTIARALPDDEHETTLPLRMYRLATVRGVVNGQPASFVLDTGGEVLSIARSTAAEIPADTATRRIPLKVYGTSGWDKDAFLLPNVNLAFGLIRVDRSPVVVLNLDAPSHLLGFRLGGIVGHKFLSRYRVSIDLPRSVVALDGATSR